MKKENKKIDIKMTSGSIYKHLFNYALPLIIGNIILLTYNAIDLIIIGKNLGETSLAAVGSVAPIMTMVIHLVSGICIGASVIISEFFGANDNKKIKTEVSTTIISGTIFTCIIAILCIIFAKKIFILLRVPNEALNEAIIYLQVVAVGFLFVFMYNVYSNALRAIGDSKTATFFLIISAIINLILDIIFVIYLGLGVFGAGFATLISQIVACVSCIIYVQMKKNILHLRKQDLIFDKNLYKKTMSYGLITAIQQAVPPLGKILLTSKVNTLSITPMAAYNATSKLDDLTIIPQQSISYGIMTCVAQNRGAKEYIRIRETMKKGLVLEFIYSIIIALITYFCGLYIMILFSPKGSNEMISLGVKYFKIIAFFYITPGITNALQSFFRGMGNMSITLITSSIQVCVRVIVAYIFIPIIGFPAVAYGMIAGWFTMLIIEVPYYFYCKNKKWKNMMI
ncbi:MAG: MATE family efflux transporter [Eubacteriales bacterium]|nr:MATE family efflux transporter [Eubacteriales bacterium]